ncbi:MAG TPA: RidA family protein [Gemmatimonadaceae bacterium]|jgi:reactive intermediate/imine deaminase|nr:RidA family protein [Gemmatimonadaceae bacterium]
MPPFARLAAVLLIAAPALAAAQKQPVVGQGQQATATLTPGIRHGDVLYVSGQLGTSRTDPDSSIQGQTKRALENIQKVVEAAGSNMANVLKCTVFLADVKDFQGMNSAYTQFFPKEPPARSTVAVAALVSPSAKVEIECIAAIPSK